MQEAGNGLFGSVTSKASERASVDDTIISQGGELQGDTSRWSKPPVDIKIVLVRCPCTKMKHFVLVSTGGLDQRDVSPCSASVGGGDRRHHDNSIRYRTMSATDGTRKKGMICYHFLIISSSARLEFLMSELSSSPTCLDHVPCLDALRCD